MAFETTPAHQAIFDAITAAIRSIIISAVAGAGKTTTIVEALKLIPSRERVVFLAFNRSIAEELALRVPSHVSAKTLNSLGLAALMSWFRSKGLRTPKIDKHKTRTLCEHFMTDDELELYAGPVVKLVGLAKGQGLIPRGDDCRHGAPFEGLLEDNLDNWLWLIERWDIDLPELDDGSDPVPVAIDFARKILDAGLRTSKVIDFDDQLFMTLAYNAPLRRFDRVFIDEAQDINPVQRELVARARRNEKSQVVAVGDPCQAIYGFRGADSQSLNAIRERFDAIELPLHVSYRCPQAVVAEARKVVSHIESHASAPKGTFVGKHTNHRDTEFVAGDMVVSRTNAPLIKVCYSNIRRGIPSFVLGRDIGRGLVALVKKLKAKNIEELETKLTVWQDQEIARIERADPKNADEKIAGIDDKAECLRVFLEMVDTVDALIAKIESMFGDKGERGPRRVMLCTVHKSKGLEAERVFVLNRGAMPSRWATQPWQVEQERNLIYVAVTRAKSELHYITS